MPEALAQLQPIKPEYITATEAGLKSDFFDQRLRFNAAIFNYTYHDLQIYNLIQSPLSSGGLVLPLTVLTNAPKAFIRGAEFELDASPIEHLTTSISLSFLECQAGPVRLRRRHARRAEFHRQPIAERAEIQCHLRRRLRASAGARRCDRAQRIGVLPAHQFFESNNNPLVAQNGYWLLDARLSYTSPTRNGMWPCSARI